MVKTCNQIALSIISNEISFHRGNIFLAIKSTFGNYFTGDVSNCSEVVGQDKGATKSVGEGAKTEN